MAVVPLFKNKVANVGVIRSRYRFDFVGGRYFTTSLGEIEMLQKLAKNKEQGVYIDPNEPEVDTEACTPMDILRKQFYAEFLEEMKAKEGKLVNAGTSSTSQEQLQAAVVSTQDSEINGPGATKTSSAAENLKARIGAGQQSTVKKD